MVATATNNRVAAAAAFTDTDYPKLIEKGRQVDTIAVGNILAVFNWPEKSERHQGLERFVDSFFSGFEKLLLPGRHPKWKEVYLAATVPGCGLPLAGTSYSNP